MKTNRITFIFHSFSRVPWGGAKMVFMYANYLSDHGCLVTICFDCLNTMNRGLVFEPIRRLLCRLAVSVEPRWYPLNPSIKKQCIFGIKDSEVPDSDHVVATAAETAYGVSSLSNSKGKKHYFIQDFEKWGISEKDVRASFRFGMSNIVVSDWLFDLVQKESGVKPTLIKNPIDATVFYEESIKRNNNAVAVLYHEGSHKGFDDLWKALTMVHEKNPELVVNAFGTPARPSWFPEWVVYTQNATQSELRKIYSSSLVYACATINEGFGLTLAESMFCGCALCSTDFLGVHEYANTNCALISPVGDYSALADNICKLLLNPDCALTLAAKGKAYAMSQCSMRKSFNALEEEFCLK